MELHCPSCGSINVGPKGNIITKTLGKVKLLKCRDCGRRFRERYVRDVKRVNPPPDLLEEYFRAKSVRNLVQMRNLSRSDKTVHRWMVNQLKNHVTWEDFLPEMAERVKFSYIMGIDTTDLSIASKKFYYLHVVDFPNNPITYEILENRDAKSIKEILLKVKALTGYEPVIAVMDMAKELLRAVKDVYPNAIIQGCLFHLRDWLDKRLPTKKVSDPHKVQEWDSVKSLVMRAALAIDYDEKEKYLNMLREFLSKSADKNVRKTIRDFLENADYYHPIQELAVFGCRPEWRYNNVCERAMKSVKDLSRKMCGFKNLDLARKYINAMWIIDTKKKIESISSNMHKEKGSEAYTLPLTLFSYDRYIDLEEAVRAYNISMDMMRSRVEMAGYIVVGDVAFAKDYIDMILQRVLRERPKTLQELMNLAGLDFNSSIKVAEALGLKLMYYSPGDPQRIFLGYSGLVTNEKKRT
ncbi:MAG: hypothetical protein ACPLKQ_07525 [Candidatus Bathyarchaeales archaeon]